MSDALESKRKFRTFNVIDDFNREVLGIDVAISIASVRVTRYLDGIALKHGYPERIRVDNGSEFTSHKFMKWAEERSIYIDFLSQVVHIKMPILNVLTRLTEKKS